jgi:hypothetical protein
MLAPRSSWLLVDLLEFRDIARDPGPAVGSETGSLSETRYQAAARLSRTGDHCTRRSELHRLYEFVCAHVHMLFMAKHSRYAAPGA